MNFSEYGSPGARQDRKFVFYFHGAPGSINESSIFEASAKDQQLNIICLDRFAIDSQLTGKAYYETLAAYIREMAAGKSVDIIGFSIGCFVAIEVSQILAKQVGQLHLISAAAPLQAGDFLEQMAGKAVFKLAKNYPKIFSALSYWQSLLGRFAPKQLYKLLFASATAKDAELAATKEFETYITPILQTCFSTNIGGYIRDIIQYVQPWGDDLSKIKASTILWHGSADNWSPLAMAEYLQHQLSTVDNNDPGFNVVLNVPLNVLKGHSHYSCLMTAAPKICAQLN